MAYTFAVTDPTNLFDNNYVTDATYYLQSSAFARWKFTTNARGMWLKTYCDIYASYPTFAEIGVFVNSVHYQTLDMTANGYNVFNVSFGIGTKIVELVPGLQSKPASSVLGSWLKAVYFHGGATVTQETLTAPEYVFYGDSLIVGANASSPMAEGVITLLRTTYGYNVACEGWGYRSLFADAPDAAGRTALSAQLAGYAPSVGVWLAIGTNDYGLATQSAEDFGIAYADLLDKLHSGLPSATIYCELPLTRNSEVANGFGDTLDDYRAQITTAQASRTSYTVLVPEWDLARDIDGTHLSTAGQASWASNIDGVLNP